MATKSWKKVGDSYYFFYDYKVVGSLQVAANYTSHVCKAKIGDKEYTFTKTGFWLDGFTIVDQNQNEIGFAKAEKWHASKLNLTLNHKAYQIKVMSNPLVEWHITEADDLEIASCGLKVVDNKLGVELGADNTNLMLEFILWYLFWPIAMENFSADIPFLVPKV